MILEINIEINDKYFIMDFNLMNLRNKMRPY